MKWGKYVVLMRYFELLNGYHVSVNGIKIVLGLGN